MLSRRRIAPRLAAAFAALVALALGATGALAQTASCSQLNAQLNALSRNGDYRNSDAASSNLRALQATMQDAQSAYNSTGCMAAQQAHQPQTPQCRAYAHQYLQAKAQADQLSRTVSNGDAVAERREEVLQQIARFGCNQGAQGQFQGGFAQPRRPRNFLEDLFGPQTGGDQGYGEDYSGQEQVEDPYANLQTSNTIRTVCVRLSDGYYWPISYSTTRDYIPQDAQTCQAECPDQQVDLYFYDNPGQEPEQMIDAAGQAYTSLPKAFAYRKAFDLSNTCKPEQTVGEVTVDASGDGETRAMVSYGGQSFPLPEPDPRTKGVASVVPAAVASLDIPLPRPRPSATAATPAPSTPPTADPVISAKSRIVKVGGKLVRVVGPDTPYAPATDSSG
jgi:hypothetical protein